MRFVKKYCSRKCGTPISVLPHLQKTATPGKWGQGGGIHDGRISAGPKPTVVMDAGIATEDNIVWLREHRYPISGSEQEKAP